MGLKIKALLDKYCEGYDKKCKLYEFKGQIWAIDASIYLFKFSYSNNSKGTINEHIKGFHLLIDNLVKNGIVPIIIFDGPAPNIKKHVIEERKKIHENNIKKLEILKETGEDIYKINTLSKNIIKFSEDPVLDIIKLCDASGIMYLKAQGEADILCNKLFKAGIINCVLSEDYDHLMFGCNLARKYMYNDNIEIIETKYILEKLKLNQEQFIELCILAGTDYTKSQIKGVGCMTAYKYLLNNNNIKDICKLHNHTECTPFLNAYEYIKNSYNFEIDIDVNISWELLINNYNKLDIKKYLKTESAKCICIE